MEMAEHSGGSRESVHQSFILHYWSNDYRNAVTTVHVTNTSVRTIYINLSKFKSELLWSN
jgi:hypothetical protein